LFQARRVAEANPNLPAALARLASAELAAGNPDEARAVARSAVRSALLVDARSADGKGQKPSSASDLPALLVAVDILIALGHTGEAEAALGSLPAERLRGITLYAELAAQRGDFDVALARLADSTGGLARALRGWLFIRTGKFPNAVRELRAASVATPSPSTLINLGYAYAALGSPRKAIRATEIAAGLGDGEFGMVAAFNLVAYFVAGGELHSARLVLDRLERRHPHMLRINLARAFVLGREGDLRGSLRELWRARSSRGYWSETDDRVEIEADVAYLEFRIGKRSRADALKIVHEQLVKTSHRSLGVANLIASLTWNRSDAKLFEAIYDSLRRVYAADDLLNLKAHLCLLTGDYRRAAELSVEWAERRPFDESALVNAVYLLADGAYDFTRATEIGLIGLRRFPGSVLLANNVAYAFAMAGDIQKAKKYLPREDTLSLVRATRGLIRIMTGQPEIGLRSYDEAAEMASDVGDDRLAKAILYRQRLLEAAVSGAELPRLPAAYEEDVYFDLQLHVVQHVRARLAEPQLSLFNS
jgi:Flp pilus assembly protein TadD